MCCSMLCLFLVLPKTKIGLICLHISSLALSAVWCLTPAPIKDGTGTFCSGKSCPFLGIYLHQWDHRYCWHWPNHSWSATKFGSNVNRRWWRCGLHSRTRKAKSRDKMLLTWWTMQRNIEFYSSICGFVVFYSKKSLGSWLRQPLFTRVYVLVISLGSTFSSGFIWLLRADISTTE